MYREATRCRACGYGKAMLAEGIKSADNDRNLLEVFDLGIQPLANDFCKKGEEQAGFAPLKVLLCPRCKLAQLSAVVRPEILYSYYRYRTSPSQTMQDHFIRLANLFRSQGNMSKVLEIGSNDGRFLHYLKSFGAEVCGIDPAENLGTLAMANGVPTITGVFGQVTADAARRVLDGPPNVIVARHVFCHIDDWKQFIGDLKYAMHGNCLTYIEVPWVKHLLERGEYDTIYHEHTSYFSLNAMEYLLKGSGLKIYSVEEYPIHGGTIMVTLGRQDSGAAFVTDQGSLDRDHIGEKAWKAFGERARKSIVELLMKIRMLRQQGKRVCGFGASAKSSVIINAGKLTRKDIEFICDSTDEKLYRLSPGSDIPITDEGALLRELPDYAVCFAWNYLPEILDKQRLYIQKGGKFIVPVPEVKIVPE